MKDLFQILMSFNNNDLITLKDKDNNVLLKIKAFESHYISVNYYHKLARITYHNYGKATIKFLEDINQGVIIMQKEYEGYEDWEELVNKYDDKDFGDATVRKQFREDFNKVSELMWNSIIKNMYRDELAKDLSEMWCQDIAPRETIGDTYAEACAYLYYASDRMNMNRWMRIRILLNYDVE